MSDLKSLVLAARKDLDLSGVLADWLEERDDPRGVLLRRRWKRWRTERESARVGDQADEERLAAPLRELVRELSAAGTMQVESAVVTSVTWRRYAADDRMRGYLMERFRDAFLSH